MDFGQRCHRSSFIHRHVRFTTTPPFLLFYEGNKSPSIDKEEQITNTLTKKIEVQPVVKVIGKTEYFVESVFSQDAGMNLSDKIRRLIDSDIESETKTLLPGETKLTSHDPTYLGSDRESEVK